MYINVCVYVCMYVCVCVCVYIYIYFIFVVPKLHMYNCIIIALCGVHNVKLCHISANYYIILLIHNAFILHNTRSFIFPTLVFTFTEM